MAQQVALRIEVEEEQAMAVVRAANIATSAASLGAWYQTNMVPHFHQKVAAAFQAEGSKELGRWAPLSPLTHAIRLRGGFPPEHPILVRTGAFKSWLTQDRGFGGFIAGPSPRINSRGGVTGTNDFILRYWFPDDAPTPELENKLRVAQRGGFGRGRRNQNYRKTPARPVVTASAPDMVWAVSSLNAWVIERMKPVAFIGP